MLCCMVLRLLHAVVVNTANVNVQPGQAEPHPSVDNGPGGRCPFLAALRTPATVHLPWHKRVQLQVRRTLTAIHPNAMQTSH